MESDGVGGEIYISQCGSNEEDEFQNLWKTFYILSSTLKERMVNFSTWAGLKSPIGAAHWVFYYPCI